MELKVPSSSSHLCQCWQYRDRETWNILLFLSFLKDPDWHTWAMDHSGKLETNNTHIFENNDLAKMDNCLLQTLSVWRKIIYMNRIEIIKLWNKKTVVVYRVIAGELVRHHFSCHLFRSHLKVACHWESEVLWNSSTKMWHLMRDKMLLNTSLSFQWFSV